MVAKKWYQKSLRRNLVDMHIENWDERFLSQFDPKTYIAMLKKAGVQAAMIYANSHVGYCYWPTKTGRMHTGLNGRDILGEMIELSHKAGMDVIIYFTHIFDNWAYDHDPSWRIIDVTGKASRETKKPGFLYGRYGTCCPNSVGYREYVQTQLTELVTRYDFEGMFLDMTFWPTVCYCESCKKRYAQEVGGEMPVTIDWYDPRWLLFQQKREEWLTEFAHLTTNTVKKLKPAVTIDHQYSLSLYTWRCGSTEAIAEACDYCGGDFYGGFMQQSFICKLFYNLTQNRPFEYHTSRCYPDLQDHTTMKTREMLELHNCIALAHYGAFLFIDAIDPIGTLNPRVYERLGEVFAKTKHYDPYLGGELCQDVAIYFSLRSKMDFAENGTSVEKTDFEGNIPHRNAAFGAARNLKSQHIPFGVISKKNLKESHKYKIIVLSDVLLLDEEEKEALKHYVSEGGNLYASGSQVCKLLADLFGLTVTGETEESLTYIAPNKQGQTLMPGIEKMYPLTIFDKQLLVHSNSPNEVMATIALPYTNPHDTTHFASIHSNPPGKTTEYPAVILRSYGKGRVLWVSHPLERNVQPPHRESFVNMIRTLTAEDFTFEADAPAAVEITVFHQKEHKRYLLNFTNIQEELPPVPVSGVKIRLKQDTWRPKRVLWLPTEQELPFKVLADKVEIEVPTLDIFIMLVLEYE